MVVDDSPAILSAIKQTMSANIVNKSCGAAGVEKYFIYPPPPKIYPWWLQHRLDAV
jgi:hypothetical protein